jgi:hypothetical protein
VAQPETKFESAMHKPESEFANTSLVINQQASVMSTHLTPAAPGPSASASAMGGMDSQSQIEGLKTQMAIMQKQLDGLNKTKAELAQYKDLYKAA